MPRKQRHYAAHIPYHIVQRGNNRNACFFSASDFGIYINALTEALEKYQVQLHAFILMTNHVHLLMTPSDSTGISRVMQSVGRTYVRAVNGLYHRTGTLWEGRHKACPIDSEHYLLVCQRYIELNPVRAAMVEHPSAYRWSSYQANGLGKSIQCITPHQAYLALGSSTAMRQQNYRALFNNSIPTDQLHTIRDCLNHNYPMGNERFKAQIEATLGYKIGHRKPGRPSVKTSS